MLFKAVYVKETCCFVFLRWVRRYRISTIRGKISRVKKVELINPPMTTMARGFWVSLPIPLDTAAGSKPIAAISAVITTGLTLD